MTKKLIISFGILLSLGFCNQVVLAQDFFGNDNFFKTIKPEQKVEPKMTPKIQPVTPAPRVEPTTTGQPNLMTPEAQEVKGISTGSYISNECSSWWQIALGLAIILITFAIFVKKKPKYFKGWHSIYLLLVPIIGSYTSWHIHDYIHYHVKNYDNAFLCYNYWFIIGFEASYFSAIYLLTFGLRSMKPKTIRKKA